MKLRKMILTASGLVCAICVLTVTSLSSKGEINHEKAPDCYYTAVKLEMGDTLDGISEKYNTSHFYSKQEYIDMVKKINGLHSDIIHAGCYLTVACYN